MNTNGFGMELDYYGGFTGAIPGIEDYLSYDIGFYIMTIPELHLKKVMARMVLVEVGREEWNFLSGMAL